MNTDFIIFLVMLLGLFFGWLSAFIAYRRKLVALKKQNRIDSLADQYEEYKRGYDDGWKSLADNPTIVKEICNQYFRTHRP